jgi:hypothetical protein
VFLTVGEVAERVSRRRLEPLPKVRDCRVEKEVLMDSLGRDWGAERARGSEGAGSGGSMGWHCSRTAWPSWMGTG